MDIQDSEMFVILVDEVAKAESLAAGMKVD